MASFSQSSIEKGSDFVREYLCSGSACKDKSTVAEVYCETCDKLFCKKCCGLHDQLFTGHNVLGKEHENKWSVSKEKDRTSQKLKVDSSRPQPGNKDPSKNLVLNKSAAIKQRVSKTSKAVEMPAKKPSQGQETIRPSRDASTAGAQGHVSSDNVSGRRVGWNDDKKKPMREGTFRTDAEKDQSELFKDELRNQLNNRERHLQQLEKERLRKEEREKRRLEEQRVSMQLEYEEAQKKIKAREAEVLKRQADERKKEAEQKRREADDEKLRKQQEQIERKRRELEQSLKPYNASSEGASWNPAGNLRSRESTEKQDYHNEKPEWLKLQSTRSVQGNPDKVFTVQWKSTHNVRIPSDSATCLINAICVLPDGKVLVADYRNKKVKLLDQQYQVFSHCGVTDYVKDMCLITPSEVAVAVSDDSTKTEVQFITVTQSKLVSGRKFRLQHKCTGIAHYQGDLFICSGEELFKYTLSGKQVCRLNESIS
ncbi:hypothetical protein DPMN_019178, partial [Dreissena polymorpha]